MIYLKEQYKIEISNLNKIINHSIFLKNNFLEKNLSDLDTEDKLYSSKLGYNEYYNCLKELISLNKEKSNNNLIEKEKYSYDVKLKENPKNYFFNENSNNGIINIDDLLNEILDDKISENSQKKFSESENIIDSPKNYDEKISDFSNYNKTSNFPENNNLRKNL